MIEKLFKEFENLKKENKELKDSIGELNKRIEKLEKNNKIKDTTLSLTKQESTIGLSNQNSDLEFNYYNNRKSKLIKYKKYKNEKINKDSKCKFFDKYFQNEMGISLLERYGFIKVLKRLYQ